MKKLAKIFVISIFFVPTTSSAHSFGILYNLPVPFWMYLYGGAAAMVVSFLFIGYFFNKKSKDGEIISYPKRHIAGGEFFTQDQTLTILRFATVFLFLLTVLSGIIGEDSSYTNFNMTFFWIIFVLGLTYLTALIGDIYSVINPWKILTGWLVDSKEKPILEYPKKFGYYPALVFYFIFIWIELMGETTPMKLSLILLVYTILNDIGVVVLGREIWFKYCEFFSVFFRLIGKIAPFERYEGKLFLRPPFVGLLKEKADHPSLVVFALFMLSSTAFDGFRETILWSRFYWGNIDGLVRPILQTNSHVVFDTVLLAFLLLVFLFIYLGLIYLAKTIARSTISLWDLACQFAFSLIPIALVYNLAHYFTLIFTEGPNIIRLISDPFGIGWDIFNTANYSSAFIPGANFVWHSQVAFILIGHIVSVYLAHVVALYAFPSGKRAVWSQLPLLILMIAYTMIGLWILSQPITGGTL